jgi:hypothetical protein
MPCEICGHPGTPDCPLVRDHNHVTGKERGILCSKCNFGLGNFDDNYTLLVRGADYLLDSPKRLAFEVTYELLSLAQGGVCAICLKTDPAGRRLAVDHDHLTNLIRGLLCGKCNPGLGMFDDNPVRLRTAGFYLVKYDGSDDPQKIWKARLFDRILRQM